MTKRKPPQILSAVKSGITRLREKGGANPQSLYDLVNGFVTISGTIDPRTGTIIDHVLPDGTAGLAYFQNNFHVFSNVAVTMTDADYTSHILVHPDDRDLSVYRIHYASPMVGALYVSAEFEDGSVYHYWLQQPQEWEADTIITFEGWTVKPLVDNGFIYVARRVSSPYPLWTADRAVIVGDRVEPAVPNGFYYEAVEVHGDNPRTGATQPVWPAEDGAEVYEDTALAYIPPPGTPTAPGGTGPIGPGPGPGTPGGGNPYIPPDPDPDPGGGNEQQ